jgi:hypothetical protein
VGSDKLVVVMVVPFWVGECYTNPTFPTGHSYTTKPGGGLFFPALAIPTGELVLPTATPATTANRGLMMPARRRTRAADRAARNNWERGINEARIRRGSGPRGGADRGL